MANRVIQDGELIDRLLADVEIRPTDEAAVLDREGRYTGAVLLLLNALCLTNGLFAARMAEDPRLLVKVKKAMSRKIQDYCRKPLIMMVSTLISDAPYPADRAYGEIFRKTLYYLIFTCEDVGLARDKIFIIVVRKLIDRVDEAFLV